MQINLKRNYLKP